MQIESALLTHNQPNKHTKPNPHLQTQHKCYISRCRNLNKTVNEKKDMTWSLCSDYILFFYEYIVAPFIPGINTGSGSLWKNED